MFWSRRKYRKPKNRQPESPAPMGADRSSTGERRKPVTPVPDRLEEAVEKIKLPLGGSEDLIIRRFHIFGTFPAAVIYFSNMANQAAVNGEIMKSLMYLPAHLNGRELPLQRLKEVILHDALYHSNGKLEEELETLLDGILRGQTVIVVDGLGEGLLLDTAGVTKRSISQPQTEQVIRGAREGFIEQLDTNVALLRYRLPTTDFRITVTKIGRVTQSRVAVCYLEGIANEALVEEVQRRLSAIDTDGILDVGYLEQYIEDNHYSPFPQLQNTERPDKAVANLLEGRVIIMVDGSPFALIAPTVFSQFYQTTEDYSERFVMVSFIRLARLLALAFSLITPSLYVAIISYNPELIPTEFAVAVSGGRAGVPFPSVVEVLIMEASMEVLREATLRLPQQIGGALSIVGVLVIGQAAVAAGFVSPITVVVIALTTIGSFATPAYNAALALRLLRFPLVFLAGMFGLYGVMIGLILIANHMLSLRSFGVPYLSPVVPGNFEGMKDTVMRAPLWSMWRRPAQLHTPNQVRVGEKVQEQLNQPIHNTLDPIKTGNEKWGGDDGISEADHGHSGDLRSD
ncbi:spore germination protein [Paenibacillus caseinilyticus]|uniref:Spore germination protein GerA n=1 Tax=Paenibacillus mucilaginosus K02 TaxID=997761 RepID=I0BK45_9BACL|nr:spore germination protein [Paenibacillus mucilaginosus]AFH62742.1 spore germination protein GerA [Paenibacillus mucilaginosus K02]